MAYKKNGKCEANKTTTLQQTLTTTKVVIKLTETQGEDVIRQQHNM